ncbi:hypothetical protein [uncultured Massilia sp.]|uniref:hypothetical protein n=1 Tax=uncultured Massilia sp. TaxID=169973 RepID=UPI0025E84CFF|nr:hypothetical protein [uncultured Massilia sp.]
MKTVRTAAAVALACFLGTGTGAAGAATEPALPAPGQLAALVFPGWSDSAGGRVHTVQVPPGGGGANGAGGWASGAARVVVAPKLVLRGDGERLTLIAGLVPAADDGRPAATPQTPMALAAYQFERARGGWRVSSRQGIFAWRGFAGTATLHAVALSERRQGLGVEYGGCWQGYCGTWLALYEVDKGGIRREPAVELALSGTNMAGAGDCAHRLQPLVRSRDAEPGARAEAVGGAEHDCYAIDSTWTIEPGGAHPGDLSIHYQGAISRSETRLSPPVAIDQRQVLRYGSGKYRAISGFNPVPPI